MALTSAKNNAYNNKYQDPFEKSDARLFKMYTSFVQLIQHKPRARLPFKVSAASRLFPEAWPHAELKSPWGKRSDRQKRPQIVRKFEQSSTQKKYKAMFWKCRSSLVKWDLYPPKWASSTSGSVCLPSTRKGPCRCFHGLSLEPRSITEVNQAALLSIKPAGPGSALYMQLLHSWSVHWEALGYYCASQSHSSERSAPLHFFFQGMLEEVQPCCFLISVKHCCQIVCNELSSCPEG